MAEGIQVSSLSPKYFCHQCSHAVSLCRENELTCPDCSTGFLEEVSKDLYEAEYCDVAAMMGSQENISQDLEDDFADDASSDGDDISLMSGLGMESIIGNMLLNVTSFNERGSERRADAPNAESNLHSPDSLADILQRIHMPDYIGATARPDTFVETGFRYLDEFIADEELDAITSQFMDEVEFTGRPLHKDQIKALPLVTLSKEEVEKGLQCTVCMDDFCVRDKAKRLPCNHLYHEKCITPWLERQATCPNCRTKIQVQVSKCARSRTSRFNQRSSDSRSRRYTEATTLSDFFTTSLNPFRFLN